MGIGKDKDKTSSRHRVVTVFWMNEGSRQTDNTDKTDSAKKNKIAAMD